MARRHKEWYAMRWSWWQDVLLCLWPGLRGLWRHGRFRSLGTAILFGVLLQTALLTSVIWPDLVSHKTRAVVCLGGLLFWATFTIPELSSAHLVRRVGTKPANREYLFRSAQLEYLRGNWFQVETLLGRLIELDPTDVDARLYLATMMRRIGRIGDAREQLDKLECLASARRWSWEMSQEREFLDCRARTANPDKRAAAIDAA